MVSARKWNQPQQYGCMPLLDCGVRHTQQGLSPSRMTRQRVAKAPMRPLADNPCKNKNPAQQGC